MKMRPSPVIYLYKQDETKKSSRTSLKEDRQELVIEENTIYEIDKECLACRQKKKKRYP